jgi:DinB superfamily
MRFRLVLLSLAAMLPCTVVAQAPAVAQQSSSPVADAFRMQEMRAARNLTAAAEEMPAEKYSFKPTDAQLTFGAVVAHLADGNYELCSAISGMPAPTHAAVTKDSPKDALVPALKASFDYCGQAFASLNDSKLSQPVTLFGDYKTTQAGAILITVGDWADHYSQDAIYMRLNGELPPTARPRPATP